MHRIERHIIGQFTGKTKEAIQKFYIQNPNEYMTSWFFRKLMKAGETIEVQCKEPHGLVTINAEKFENKGDHIIWSVTIPITEGHAIKFKSFKKEDVQYILVE